MFCCKTLSLLFVSMLKFQRSSFLLTGAQRCVILYRTHEHHTHKIMKVFTENRLWKKSMHCSIKPSANIFFQKRIYAINIFWRLKKNLTWERKHSIEPFWCSPYIFSPRLHFKSFSLLAPPRRILNLLSLIYIVRILGHLACNYFWNN